MFRFRYVFLLCFAYISCKSVNSSSRIYKGDNSISDQNGAPRDSATCYFPNELWDGDSLYKLDIGDFSEKWFSSALYAAHEPILSNYYLGHDTYRFLLLRNYPFGPVVISLHKDENGVRLNAKELDKEPKFYDLKLVMPKEYVDTILPNKEKHAKTSTRLILDTTIKLSQREWDTFESKLADCSFWNLDPCLDCDMSGQSVSRLLIEGHLHNRYWFVCRWASAGEFTDACNYLIKKSGF